MTNQEIQRLLDQAVTTLSADRPRQVLVDRLLRWADARDRRNPTGHGKNGTSLLREAAAALREPTPVNNETGRR